MAMLFHIAGNRTTFVVALLLLSSFITNQKIKRVILIFSIIVFVISISLNFSKILLFYLACGIHLIIFGIIIMNFLNRIFNSQSLNLFLSLLIIYESIYIFKYVAVIFNNQNGSISWFVGSVSQFLFAILFAFININTKDFPLLRKLD
jgi:hypothetical protein